MWFVGSYTEEIPTPYGMDEAAHRIGIWLRKGDTILKVREKGNDFVLLKGRIGSIVFGVDLAFLIHFRKDRIEFEGWFGDRVKSTIKPGSWHGKYSKDIAWSEFMKIKRILQVE